MTLIVLMRELISHLIQMTENTLASIALGVFCMCYVYVCLFVRLYMCLCSCVCDKLTLKFLVSITLHNLVIPTIQVCYSILLQNIEKLISTTRF